MLVIVFPFVIVLLQLVNPRSNGVFTVEKMAFKSIREPEIW